MTEADNWLEKQFADRLAGAKEAFDSGNDLGALDAWHLCRHRGVNAPAWVLAAMPIDPDTARHRHKKTGRHARARRFTEEQIEHVERYHAVVFARTHLREPWRSSANRPHATNAYQAARVWLAADCQKAVKVLVIKRSYKLVAAAKRRKQAARFWIPASQEVLSLFRDRDHQTWVSYPTKMD